MKTWESMGRRDKTHDWSWEDAFTGWRKLLCYTQRPGLVAKVKRQHNKRVRQLAKAEIRRGDY